ncbi:MAG: hypothetical protein ABEH80_06715 [Halobaculum sp.]
MIRHTSSDTRSRSHVSLALVVLVLLAGCGGSTGAGEAQNTVNPALDQTPTVSPTATPTPAYPAGVDRDGVDPFRVASVHGDALREQSGAVAFRRTVTTANGTVVLASVTVGRVDGERLYYSQRGWRERAVVSQPLGPNVTVWSDGERSAVRFTSRGNILYRYTTDGPRLFHRQAASGQDDVYGLLTPWELQLVGERETDAGTVQLLRATADRARRADGRLVENLSVGVRLGPTGVVRAATVEYDVTLQETPVTVRETFRVTALGNVSVSRPAWVDTARNRSTSLSTPTPTANDEGGEESDGDADDDEGATGGTGGSTDAALGGSAEVRASSGTSAPHRDDLRRRGALHRDDPRRRSAPHRDDLRRRGTDA